jgi:hypothetical protein
MLNRFFFGGVQAWFWGAGGIPRFRIPTVDDPGAIHSILREVLLGMGGTRRLPVVSPYEAPAQKHDEHRDHAKPYVVRKLKLPHSPKFYPKEAPMSPSYSDNSTDGCAVLVRGPALGAGESQPEILRGQTR